MRIVPLQREVAKTPSVRTAGTGETQVPPGPGRWVVLAAIYLLSVLITAPFLVNKPPTPREGEQAPARGIRAEVTFSAELPSLREAWEARRDRQHTRVWRYDGGVGNQAQERLESILERAAEFDLSGNTEDIIRDFRRDIPALRDISDERIGETIRLLQDRRMRDSLREIIDLAYSRHVVTAELPLYQEHRQRGVLAIINENQLPRQTDLAPGQERYLRYPVDRLSWPETLLLRVYEKHYDGRPREVDETIALRVLQSIVRPALIRDTEATTRQFEQFDEDNFTRDFREGRLLVSPSDSPETINAETALILREHRRAVDLQHRFRLLGHSAYVLIVFLILGFYVSKFSQELRFTIYNTLLISLPVLLALCAQFVVILVAEGSFETVGYLFPAGAIGMLGVLLLEVRMALLLVTWGCLLMGLQVDLQFEYVVVALFGGYTAVAALHTLRKRWDAFRASVLVGIANMAVVLVLSFVENPLGVPPVDKAFVAFVGGIATFLVLAILPLIERFGILTDIQLLEMSGLHHKLLRDVEEQAPGTWQHTLNVAKLAEAAATEIGVNYLLVRAGCYFHDIGKVRKPEFFTENQNSPEDKQRHDSLKPIMSARVIMNHVKEGAEMARAYGLPIRIIDFITQHHGTSIIQYFYMKAQKAHESGEVKEAPRQEDYRYPGPKPQTIEAAIVMLADSVEATATAKLSSRTVREDEIRKIVYDTILEKFNDGQFDECNLTLRDLTVIRQTFIRVLKSRFHTRIDYPKKSPAQGARKQPRDKSKDRISKEKQKDSDVSEDSSPDGLKMPAMEEESAGKQP
ncbi:MAG: HDIG domain-containing protein [Candidatus Sumerlaeia bacterium]|nr:HDIG domain-containing protein [Candidatus Sumerlaeia bacterium]